MRVKAVGSDRSRFNFKPSGIGDSWLIGTDVYSNTNDWANAFPNGVSGCPPNLIIPSTLTDEYGQTKKVEIIGQYAFESCANKDNKGQTRKLTLTKQVKVIKFRGLGYLKNLEEFVIEEGSVLETIESYGLHWIGYDYGKTESKRVTLTLPSTLSSVFGNGIYDCNLFNVIIYCGSHPLSNSSNLEWVSSGTINDTVVKVSSEYPSDENIFGRNPDRNSQAEVEEKCSKMEDRPNFTSVPVDGGCEVTGWGNSSASWCPPSLEIPEKIYESAVVSINESAFANCENNGTISLPSTLKRVGASAFANTWLVTAIIINSTDLEIGDAAFEDCGKNATQPLRVSLPQNTQLNGSAFEGANLGEVYIR